MGLGWAEPDFSVTSEFAQPNAPTRQLLQELLAVDGCPCEAHRRHLHVGPSPARGPGKQGRSTNNRPIGGKTINTVNSGEVAKLPPARGTLHTCPCENGSICLSRVFPNCTGVLALLPPCHEARFELVRLPMFL